MFWLSAWLCCGVSAYDCDLPLVEDAPGWERLCGWRFPRRPSVLALRAPLLPSLAPGGTLPRPWSESRLWLWGLPDDDPRPWLAWTPEAVLVDDPPHAYTRLTAGIP